jgi:hypothetical protein
VDFQRKTVLTLTNDFVDGVHAVFWLHPVLSELLAVVGYVFLGCQVYIFVNFKY